MRRCCSGNGERHERCLPLQKAKLPRRGDCAACRAYHAGGKRLPRCERRPVRTAPVTVLAVLAVLGLLGGILAVVCRKVPAAGICWAAAALAAGLAYDIGKGRNPP